MDIRGAATIAAGVTIGAAGIGLGVLAGRADEADLYNPLAMTAAGGNPIGLLANGTLVLGLGGFVGTSAIAAKLGHPAGSTAGSIGMLIAGVGAGPAAWLAAELVDGD